MMIKHYTKPFSIFTSVVLSLILVVLNMYFNVEPVIRTHTLPLSDNLIAILSNNKLSRTISIFLFANVIALFSYLINDKFIILNKKSYFPYFIPATLLVAGPYMQTLSEAHFSLLFVFPALYTILILDENNNKNTSVLNASLWLAVGSFFQLQTLLFLPAIWIGASIQHSFNFKALQASIVGVLLCYAFVLGLYYVFGSINTILNPIQNIFHLHYDNFKLIPEGFWALFIIVNITIIIGSFSFLKYRPTLNTASKKSMEIFIVFLLFNIIYFILGFLPLQDALIYGAISVGIIVSGLWLRISIGAQRLLYYSYLMFLLVSFIVKF